MELQRNNLFLHWDQAFEYIRKANPKIKVHGFAVTSFNLMMKYSWFSVDSTTWLKHAAYGNVMVPKYDIAKKKFDYCTPPLIVSVSDVSLYKPSKHPHYSIAFAKEVVERIDQYFHMAGVDLEKLQTSLLERQKVNIYFYEQLLKDEAIHRPSKYKSDQSFF